MARIKKAKKGTALGFEEKMNQNIDNNIKEQMDKLDQGLQTATPTATQTPTKKFKIGSREVDLTDDFLQNFSDDLYKNNIQGQSVSTIMDLIRSGGIEGIDEGGNFYGTNLGGAEKNTRANRAWNIGRRDIRDLQDTGRKMTGVLRGTYDRLNKPVEPEAPKTHNLSNRATDILSTYAYHGNAVPTGWNNMSIDERVRSYGTAIGGFQNKLGEFEGQKYDPKIHMNISEQAYNNLIANRANLLSDYNEMSKRWLADGIVDENEINEYRLKTGVDLGGQFGTRQLTAEEAQKAEADKKVEEEKLAKEKAEKEAREARSVAYNPETGRYTLGGNPYTGDWTDEQGNKLAISEGSLYTGLNETDDDYIPYYKGKPMSFKDIQAKYNDPNLPESEKEGIYKLYASVSDAAQGFYTPQEHDQRRSVGRGVVEGFSKYRFIDSDLAPSNLVENDKGTLDYRIYEGISNIPSQYGVTSGKRVVVLETPQGRKEGIIREVGGEKYLYPNDGSGTIKLSGDASKRNTRYYYNSGSKSVTGSSTSPKHAISNDEYNALSKEERNKYKLEEGKWVPRKKNGGRILYAQEGTKLVYQEAPKESTMRGKSVDFDKIKAYRNATAERDNLQRQSATGREVFDKNVELSVADKADLTALGLDVAGLVAGFTGIGSVGAGILGGASTAAQLGADISRDGLDWGDVGNAAMGFGLDVTSALPGLGQFSKGAKTLKALKKSSKVLGGLFATYGLVNGTQGLKNVLEKGQDATIDDWKMLAQGLQSIAMGSKQGMKYLGTKKTDPKFHLKLDKKNIEFNSEEAAKSFAKKHKDWNTKKSELAGIEDIDSDAYKQKKQEIESLEGELKKEAGEGFNIDGFLKNKTNLNPLKFKGFGKKGERNFNPIGVKDSEAKVYQTSGRQILSKEEAKGKGYATRISAAYLRKNNNLNPDLTEKEKGSFLDRFKSETSESNTPTETKPKKSFLDRFKSNKSNKSETNKPSETSETNKPAETEVSKPSEKPSEKPKKGKYLNSGKAKEARDFRNNKKAEEIDNKRSELENRKKEEKDYTRTKKENKEKGQQKAKEIAIERLKNYQKETSKTSSKNSTKETPKKTSKEAPKETKAASGNKKTQEETNAKRELEEAKDLLQEKINKLEDNKNKKPKLKRKDIRKATKGQDKSFNRTDSHDSKKSKDKAKDRKNYEKTKRSAEKKGIYLRKEGGILYLQQGNKLSWGGGDNIETGANWKKLGNLVTSVATPSNARFAATLVGNKKMMSELEKAKRPTNASPVYLNRLSNVGISQITPQISDINKTINSSQPFYSDAKLNAAVKLSQLSSADKMKSDLYGQLNNQNRQIDAQNQQIGQQEALQNAQIVQQNAAKQDAFNQGLLTNKLGLIGSNVDAFSNKMLEMERAQKLKQSRIDQLNDQEFAINQQMAQRQAMNNFQDPWIQKAKDAGKDWNTYYNEMSREDMNAYLESKAKAENQYLLDKNKAQKTYFQKYQRYASGGKMTLEEKKELESLKAYKKRQLESDKAFNKLVLEKGKSHDKMLSLLSKDLKTSVKNILK